MSIILEKSENAACEVMYFKVGGVRVGLSIWGGWGWSGQFLQKFRPMLRRISAPCSAEFPPPAPPNFRPFILLYYVFSAVFFISFALPFYSSSYMSFNPLSFRPLYSLLYALNSAL